MPDHLLIDDSDAIRTMTNPIRLLEREVREHAPDGDPAQVLNP
ncbi:hypothetical protein C8K30_101802 [Promicromonospora sp. AC04]|nr:hypothetical protein [Promicromonospora sp. AC04]PUB32276.1 hypothetical protein C8K30_101802 [Promicromonospora sp. AC04]